MEVAISALRSELASWVKRAGSGEEIIVTERGVPVARLTGVRSAPLLEQLTRQGVLRPPRRSGRPSARDARRVAATAPVADLVGEQRR